MLLTLKRTWGIFQWLSFTSHLFRFTAWKWWHKRRPRSVSSRVYSVASLNETPEAERGLCCFTRDSLLLHSLARHAGAGLPHSGSCCEMYLHWGHPSVPPHHKAGKGGLYILVIVRIQSMCSIEPKTFPNHYFHSSLHREPLSSPGNSLP